MAAPSSDYWFQALDVKLDRILEKLDSHGTTLATHAARITGLEEDIRELKDKANRVSAARVAVWTAVASIVASGLFTVVSTFLH